RSSHRRGWRYLTAGGAMTAAALALALARQPQPHKPTCVAPADRFNGIWEAAGHVGRRVAIGNALRASGKPYADASFASLSRQQVESLRNRLVDVTALENAGHYSRALAKAAAVAAEARAVNYRPLVAEALYHLGRLHLDVGQVTQAADSLEQALWIAEASRHD